MGDTARNVGVKLDPLPLPAHHDESFDDTSEEGRSELLPCNLARRRGGELERAQMTAAEVVRIVS